MKRDDDSLQVGELKRTTERGLWRGRNRHWRGKRELEHCREPKQGLVVMVNEKALGWDPENLQPYYNLSVESP